MGGVIHCHAHIYLTKFHDLTFMVKHGAMIGKKNPITYNFILELLQKRELYSHSQRCVTM
jgi:hypothetical protein